MTSESAYRLAWRMGLIKLTPITERHHRDENEILLGEKGNKRAENDTVNSFLVAERRAVTFACILKEGHVCGTGVWIAIWVKWLLVLVVYLFNNRQS